MRMCIVNESCMLHLMRAWLHLRNNLATHPHLLIRADLGVRRRVRDIDTNMTVLIA